MLGKIVTRLNELLLAGLQLDLRTERIDGGTESGFLLVNGLIVERMSVLQLRFSGFDSSCIRNGQQVCVAHCEYD